MIYLKQNESKQTINIPCLYRSSGILTLCIHNSMTGKSFNLEVEDLNTSRAYYTFEMVLPEGMNDGEYDYCLMDGDGDISAKGLLQVGDYKPETQAYNEKKKDYITYNG